MSKLSFAVSFAAGLAAVMWVGLGFARGGWLPLAMTALILAVYVLGALELRRFRAATESLRAALESLTAAPPALADWLQQLPAALRPAVRLRIEAERGALPGPALTPYLVGLLVMLGMLGTFLGMVATFQGAVFALEGSTDLQAIRAALTAPVKGLGLSFGTSVAGVAASAMLGLMSALSRRERLDAGRLLDSRIAGELQSFSLVHQRQETFRALQAQAVGLPQLVDALQMLAGRIEQRSGQLDQQLLERHALFQREATQAYSELARNVGAALQESLATGARQAGDSIRPVVERAMTQVAQESQRTHERFAAAAQAQLDALTQQFEQRSATLVRDVAQFAQLQSERSLEQSTQLLEQSRELVQAHQQAEARWIAQQGERMEQLTGLWRTELAALRTQEHAHGEAAVARLGELEAAVTRHLAALGTALEEPITKLLRTASEVPEAAAGVVAQLRDEMTRVAERDNLALQERTALLAQLGSLMQSVHAAAGEQKTATEALLASASAMLEQAGQRFGDVLQSQSAQAADAATHVAAGAVELASVADAFGQGVQLFHASNERMIETLQRVEASLNRSTARSDEQLAYYVAQAREVIDLSIASQQGLVEKLRTVPERGAAAATREEVAG